MTEQAYAVIPERLQQVTHLDVGEHEESAGGPMCAMEAVAYVAGEPWSDAPKCCCPILGDLVRSWNDGLADDDERNDFLIPLIPQLVGTKGSEELSSRRLELAADWIFRVYLTIWIDHAAKSQGAPLYYGNMIWKLPKYYKVGATPMLRLALSEALSEVETNRVIYSHRIPSPVILDAAWTPGWALLEKADDESMCEMDVVLNMARRIVCCIANTLSDGECKDARLKCHYAFGYFLFALIRLSDHDLSNDNDDAVRTGVKDWLAMNK